MDQKINVNKVNIYFKIFLFLLKIFKGKYSILLLDDIEKREFISPRINGSRNGTCLTLYYYLTKRDSVLLLTYYFNEEGLVISLLMNGI